MPIAITSIRWLATVGGKRRKHQETGGFLERCASLWRWRRTSSSNVSICSWAKFVWIKIRLVGFLLRVRCFFRSFIESHGNTFSDRNKTGHRNDQSKPFKVRATPLLKPKKNPIYKCCESCEEELSWKTEEFLGGLRRSNDFFQNFINRNDHLSIGRVISYGWCSELEASVRYPDGRGESNAWNEKDVIFV